MYFFLPHTVDEAALDRLPVNLHSLPPCHMVVMLHKLSCIRDTVNVVEPPEER